MTTTISSIPNTENTNDLLSEIYKLSTELFNNTKNFMEIVQTSVEGDVRNSNEKILQNIKYLMETSLLIGIGGKLEDADFDRERNNLEKIRILDEKSSLKKSGAYRARPEMLLIDEDEEKEEENNNNCSESDSNESIAEEQSKLARPIKNQLPKIGAIQEEVEEKQKQEAMSRLKRVKKRALKSSLIKDLRSEFNEAPEEIFERKEMFGQPKATSLKRDRKKYEEDYFVRLNTTKKEKAQDNKKRFVSEFDKLLSFGNYMVDENPTTTDGEGNPRKRRKFDTNNKKFSSTTKKTDKKPKKYKNNRRKH